MENLPPELCDLDEDEKIRTELANESDTEGQEEKLNRLDNFRQVASESCIFPAVSTSEYIEIAPGEDKMPKSVILDKNCEELAFPHLLSTGNFGCTTERETKISPVKYFNQRLLNYKQIGDYKQIFLFSLFKSCTKKVFLLKCNCRKVETLVTSDKGFVFMNTIKGTPAFLKRFQLEVLAMIRQLECPTFLTLKRQNISEEHIKNMSYFQKCEILNENSV